MSKKLCAMTLPLTGRKGDAAGLQQRCCQRWTREGIPGSDCSRRVQNLSSSSRTYTHSTHT